DLLRRTLGQSIDIETLVAPGLWHTMIDPHQFENAVLNLAVNAREAMPEGGKLTLELENEALDERYVAAESDVPPGQYVMLAVTDNGVGMPAEILARAFDPFFSTKSEGAGTGLGLSMAYGFVKQSGGHIRIYSEVGYGTTVKAYFPRS
ncbi:ATP-binding protein, partial [Paraburkholderia sp. BCC1876]